MKRLNAIAAVLFSFGAIAYGQNIAAQPAFDAASVKIAHRPFGPGALQLKGGPGTSDPGRMTWGAAQLQSLLLKAYGMDFDFYRIVGPAWLSGRGSELYAITATMPPKTTQREFRLMLQNLLTERFQIKMHHETRMFPGYDLVVAPGGSKVKPAADPDAPDAVIGMPTIDAQGFATMPPGHGHIIAMINGTHATFQSFTMAEFLTPWLEMWVTPEAGPANHVEDKTGLTGKYDFTLKFEEGRNAEVVVGAQVRAAIAAEAASADDPGSGLPNIFKAVEQQLGLKLVKAKGFPLDVIVIDHAEKIPADN